MTKQVTDDLLSRIVMGLAKRDEQSRLERAERTIEIERIRGDFSPLAVGLVAGGHESGRLFLEAVGCYVEGFYGSALVCAHGSCERELAGRVAHYALQSPPGPKNWERWGLGRLLEHAKKQQWFSPASQVLLEEVNGKRRDFYHLHEKPGADDLFTRTYNQLPWRGKDAMYDDMTTTLRSDALQAIRAAFIVRDE